MTITFKNYETLLKELKRFNYQFICSYKFNSFLNKEKMFILNKHDIERSTENALKAALIESRLQIQSTYFIQEYLINKDFDIKNILKIKDLGHEIAYHYDCLDKFKGNYDLAIRNFQKNINKFLLLGIKIKSICPHGNAAIKRNGWSSNKDLSPFIKEVYGNEIFDIVMDIKNCKRSLKYISDAGYKFNYINQIWSVNPTSYPIKEFNKNSIKDEYCNLIISTHTHRFNESILVIFLNKLLLDFLRKVYKILKKFKIIKFLISKIYSIGKFL